MRKPLIVGNWKMYKTTQEATTLVNGLLRALVDIEEADIAVCPPFTALSLVAELLIDSRIALGAQNVYVHNEGAFTGEISPAMLKEVGCAYVIIGHSERRKYFHETDATVNAKILAAQKAALMPIVCIGETLEEREKNVTIEVITEQLKAGLSGVDEDKTCGIVIAYEPVWAIGTGKTATPQQAEEVHAFIRSWCARTYGDEYAATVRILYGGSVKPSNTRELMNQPDIDGALVGGASLEVDSFAAIVKNSL